MPSSSVNVTEMTLFRNVFKQDYDALFEGFIANSIWILTLESWGSLRLIQLLPYLSLIGNFGSFSVWYTHITCFYACAQYIQYFLEAIIVVSIFFLVFVESKARWPPFHYSMILANSSHPDISCSQWLAQQSMTWNFSLLQEPLPALLREQLPVKGQLLYNAAMHKPSLDLPQRKKWKRRH